MKAKRSVLAIDAWVEKLPTMQTARSATRIRTTNEERSILVTKTCSELQVSLARSIQEGVALPEGTESVFEIILSAINARLPKEKE